MSKSKKDKLRENEREKKDNYNPELCLGFSYLLNVSMLVEEFEWSKTREISKFLSVWFAL